MGCPCAKGRRTVPVDRLDAVLARWTPQIIGTAFNVPCVKPEYLAALVARETDPPGEIGRALFEPHVLDRLRHAAAGDRKAGKRLGGLGPPEIAALATRENQVATYELAEVPRTYGDGVKPDPDETVDFERGVWPHPTPCTVGLLIPYASSWGPLQVMGYHVHALGDDATVSALRAPDTAFSLAARFIKYSYSGEIEEACLTDKDEAWRRCFRSHNTGRPDGKTHDPEYAEKGLADLRRARLLLAAPPSPAGISSRSSRDYTREDWAAIQSALQRKRFYLDGLVDGESGPKTLRAVCAFQRAIGLDVDGDPGPQTRAALGLK